MGLESGKPGKTAPRHDPGPYTPEDTYDSPPGKRKMDRALPMFFLFEYRGSRALEEERHDHRQDKKAITHKPHPGKGCMLNVKGAGGEFEIGRDGSLLAQADSDQRK